MQGGDWHEGGESFQIYDGSYLASELNTVVVVTNYRLVALGFLFAEPGSWGDANVGLSDQRLAIEWMHNNAANFGANASKAMLFGQSAGGESVLIHLTSPQNPVSKYFSSAVVESGPLGMNFKYPQEAKTLAQVSCFSESV